MENVPLSVALGAEMELRGVLMGVKPLPCSSTAVTEPVGIKGASGLCGLVHGVGGRFLSDAFWDWRQAASSVAGDRLQP